jgi:hypothetical protein
MAPPNVKPTPTQSTKQSSTSPLPIDDDDKWTDILEKEEKDSTSQTEPIPRAHGVPFVQMPQNIHLESQPIDIFGRPQSSIQTDLENQLMHLGQVELGLLNAVDILERCIVKGDSHSNLEESIFPGHPGSNRAIYKSMIYSQDRSSATQLLRDMGYLIGLKRAVKILQDALSDDNREDIKYSFKAVSPVPLPPVQLQPFPIPNQSLVSFPATTAEKELRAAAKDIVKETVREYRDEVVIPGTEAVQQEMIKLCRDVCRDALARKE